MKPHTFEKRVTKFLEKVKMVATGCWEFTGDKTTTGGYGLISDRSTGRRIRHRAHRFSWMLFRGPIPDNLLVLHKCDNPPCVNPDHLFLGTNADNLQDMCRKGRHGKTGAVGSKNARSKLTESQVLSIRALRQTGISPYVLAKEFNVSYDLIWRIMRRDIWKHI